MTLRTSALVAGLLGIILLIIGLFADSRRPDTEVVATATVTTAVAVLPPEIVAIEGATKIAVTADGTIEAHTARPVDADAWIGSRSATVVTGIGDWETLTTRTAERIVSTPSPSPSPTTSATAAPSPAPSPSPSPSPSPGADESADIGSTDHWRRTFTGDSRLAILATSVPLGETLVISTTDGSALGTIEFTLQRQVNDGWVTPLIVWGALLTLAGLIALILLLVDVRPWQRKGEEWAAERARVGAGDDGPQPGSRRAKRVEGPAVPVAELESAPVADDDDAHPKKPKTKPTKTQGENPDEEAQR